MSYRAKSIKANLIERVHRKYPCTPIEWLRTLNTTDLERLDEMKSDRGNEK